MAKSSSDSEEETLSSIGDVYLCGRSFHLGHYPLEIQGGLNIYTHIIDIVTCGQRHL